MTSKYPNLILAFSTLHASARGSSTCLSPIVSLLHEWRSHWRQKVHPQMLPQPSLELFQYWSIIFALSVIWVHLQTHAWLKMKHLVSPGERQLPYDFLQGLSPLRWLSISYMFYQFTAGTTTATTLLARSHTTWGKVAALHWDCPQGCPTVRYIRLLHCVSLCQQHDPFNSFFPYYLWLCQAVFGCQLCYVTFPVETWINIYSSQKRVLMTDQRKDSI